MRCPSTWQYVNKLFTTRNLHPLQRHSRIGKRNGKTWLSTGRKWFHCYPSVIMPPIKCRKKNKWMIHPRLIEVIFWTSAQRCRHSPYDHNRLSFESLTDSAHSLEKVQHLVFGNICQEWKHPTTQFLDGYQSFMFNSFVVPLIESFEMQFGVFILRIPTRFGSMSLSFFRKIRLRLSWHLHRGFINLNEKSLAINSVLFPANIYCVINLDIGDAGPWPLTMLIASCIFCIFACGYNGGGVSLGVYSVLHSYNFSFSLVQPVRTDTKYQTQNVRLCVRIVCANCEAKRSARTHTHTRLHFYHTIPEIMCIVN